MAQSFDPKEIFDLTWKSFLKSPSLFLIAGAGSLVISAILVFLASTIILAPIALPLLIAAQAYASLVLIKASFAALQGNVPQWSEVLKFDLKEFLWFLLLFFIASLILTATSVLIVLPIAAYAVFFPSFYLIVARKIPFQNVFSLTFKIIAPYFPQLIVYSLIVFVAVFLSSFPLFGLGFIISMPLIAIANAVIYNKLTAELPIETTAAQEEPAAAVQPEEKPAEPAANAEQNKQ